MAFYLAYDSDMDIARVVARCPGARKIRNAKIPFHRPEFVEYGGKSVIDLAPDEKKEVWGALYVIPDVELLRLDLAPEPGKSRRIMPVWDSDNRVYAAHVFTGDAEGAVAPPDKEYHARLINFIRMNELPDKYADALIAIKPKP